MLPVSSEDELWKSGKSEDDTAKESVDEEDTLDLSSPSPEVGNNSDLDLSPLALTSEEEESEDNWTPPPVIPNDIGISMKAIGVIGTVTILLLTGLLYILLAQQGIEISVPNEKYEEEIIYDVNGSINFDSTLDIPLPIGFIDNDIVINDNFNNTYTNNQIKDLIELIIIKFENNLGFDEELNYLEKISDKKKIHFFECPFN